MLKLSAKLLHFFETNKKKSKNLQLEQGKGLLFPAPNLCVPSVLPFLNSIVALTGLFLCHESSCYARQSPSTAGYYTAGIEP